MSLPRGRGLTLASKTPPPFAPFSSMSEIPAGSRNRWSASALRGNSRDTQLWAEGFFTSQTGAFDYYERRGAEHPTGRVHRPVPAQEGDSACLLIRLVSLSKMPRLGPHVFPHFYAPRHSDEG
jgi:hypothetical protein